MPIQNSAMCIGSPCAIGSSFVVLDQTVQQILVYDAFACADDQYQSLSLTVTFHQDSALGHCSATPFKFQQSESSQSHNLHLGRFFFQIQVNIACCAASTTIYNFLISALVVEPGVHNSGSSLRTVRFDSKCFGDSRA